MVVAVSCCVVVVGCGCCGQLLCSCGCCGQLLCSYGQLWFLRSSAEHTGGHPVDTVVR